MLGSKRFMIAFGIGLVGISLAVGCLVDLLKPAKLIVFLIGLTMI